MRTNIPAARRFGQDHVHTERLALFALVVMLAGLLLPGTSRTKTDEQKKIALRDQANLAAAIDRFFPELSHHPAASKPAAFDVRGKALIWSLGPYENNRSLPGP